MITTTLTLTTSPQLVTVSSTGARLQSVDGLRFNWKAADSTPSTDNPVKDNDVFIGTGGKIYVWGINGQNITVTQ